MGGQPYEKQLNEAVVAANSVVKRDLRMKVYLLIKVVLEAGRSKPLPALPHATQRKRETIGEIFKCLRVCAPRGKQQSKKGAVHETAQDSLISVK
jgi:hypothetical protein